MKNAKKINLAHSDEHSLTYLSILRFYVPLGISAIAISMANLLLNRCIGLFPDSDVYMSSFSVARSMTFLFQSLIAAVTLMITTFTVNERTFRTVNRYILVLCTLLAGWLMVLAYTPIGRHILHNFYNLDGILLDNAVIATRLAIFFPLEICVRTYFLGIAIKLRSVKIAALGSIIRVAVIFALSLFIPQLLRIMDPIYLAGTLLITMGFVECMVYALGVIFQTRGQIQMHLMHALRQQNTYISDGETSTLHLIKFSAPLILSFALGALLPSFTKSALALGENNVKTIAVYTIVASVINIVAAFSFQLPQLLVNNDTTNAMNRLRIRRFAMGLGAISIVVMVLIAFTPVGDFVFLHLLKTDASNVAIAKLSCVFALIFPASVIFMAYKRGKLIKIKKTSMLVFEMAIGSVLPYFLVFIIPIIEWRYAAAVGVMMLSVANIIAGVFDHLVFVYHRKKDPQLIQEHF